MPFKKPDYPVELTNAHWQKKKGAIAKIAGKTGIGAALEQAEAAYNAVDWRLLDVNLNMPQGQLATSEAAAKVYDAAKRQYESYVTVRLLGKLMGASVLAKDTAAKWKKKPLIPKTTIAAADDVYKAAGAFTKIVSKSTMFAQITLDYKDNLAGIKQNEKIKADNAKRLKYYCLQIVKGARSITTAAEFNGKFWSENIRGIGTALPMLSAELGIVAEHKAWRTFASEAYKAKTDDEVPDKMREMVPVLKKIATALAAVK